MFYRDWTNGNGFSYISSGLGLYKTVSLSNIPLSASCESANNRYQSAAHCNSYYGFTECPKGWGNAREYLAFRPGCYQGSYYPNATPASNTNIFTGSCSDNYHPTMMDRSARRYY